MGKIHKITGAFSGTPAIDPTNWRVTAISTTTETTAAERLLYSPVLDSGDVRSSTFFTSSGGYLHSINPASQRLERRSPAGWKITPPTSLIRRWWIRRTSVFTCSSATGAARVTQATSTGLLLERRWLPATLEQAWHSRIPPRLPGTQRGQECLPGRSTITTTTPIQPGVCTCEDGVLYQGQYDCGVYDYACCVKTKWPALLVPPRRRALRRRSSWG